MAHRADPRSHHLPARHPPPTQHTQTHPPTQHPRPAPTQPANHDQTLIEHLEIEHIRTRYRLVTAGTIEEKVYHRQIYKQHLTNKVRTRTTNKARRVLRFACSSACSRVCFVRMCRAHASARFWSTRSRGGFSKRGTCTIFSSWRSRKVNQSYDFANQSLTQSFDQLRIRWMSVL